MLPIESMVVRAIGAFASGSGRRGSLIVLTYHRVLPAYDPLLENEPSVEQFAGQLDLLSSNFNILPLAEAVARLAKNSLPSRALSITFDDGYANNYQNALPLLEERGIPATIFVAPGLLDGGRMFNDLIIEAIRSAPAPALDLDALGLGYYPLVNDFDRRNAASRVIGQLKYLHQDFRYEMASRIVEHVGAAPALNLMMSKEQVRDAARRGLEIGAHTMTHPILRNTDDDLARREIVESRGILREITGQPVSNFAYPNGRPGSDYDARHVAMVREAGFTASVTTAWGCAARGADMLQLPRIAPWDKTARRFSARILRAYRQRAYARVE